MKNIALYLILGILVFSCRLTDRSDREVGVDILNNPSSEFSADPDEMPVLTFDEQVHNFGTLSQGENLTHAFTFVNTGKSPLVLSFVEGSCGCTVMKDWPKEPILPGEGGEIKAEFNSKGKSGTQNISITVVANTSPATTVLALEGEVVSPN